MGATAHTPMFRQYLALKEQNAESILLYRMGDFYEMFFEDAKVASRILDLTLTARGKGTDNVVPMCGFPHHQLEGYTARLVRANKSVAICDQVEDPKKAKGLVKREVVRKVTPGTLADPNELVADEHHWIAALFSTSGRVGVALADASTGRFVVWESDDSTAASELLRSFAPSEVIHPEEGAPELPALDDGTATPYDTFAFAADAAERALCEQFAVASLQGYGLGEARAAVCAAGALLQYLHDTQRSGWEHLDPPRLHDPGAHLLLDTATRRNLELFRSIRHGGREGSFLEAIDHTVTAAGGRLLRDRLARPLIDAPAIVERQQAVRALLEDGAARTVLRDALHGVHDIERLLGRAVSGAAHPRDLAALRASLERLPALADRAGALASEVLAREAAALDRCEEVRAELERALVDEPPVALRDGGVVRDGYNAELDELRALQRDGKQFIGALEASEREATGIASLKVRFNKVFGYFIEVSKANLHLVPEHYVRKQTIAGGERYVTPELKEHEARVLNAQERIESLELELFAKIRRAVADQARRLKAAAAYVAGLDVTAALAEIAADGNWARPTIVEERRLSIVAGRHPVVERTLAAGRFVPNHTELDEGRAIAVLTGPNMGGKSTYLRQVALIAILAQIGAYVPAESAELGLVDRIFCRVGASDSLAEGQSTFMVEMTETANILHHATADSLVVLDEIGRGTATFDGLSIAWAVVEHLHATEPLPPRTLFATHYHELTELAVDLRHVVNLKMAVRESGERVIFLHRVDPGAADRSYGIQVARLAGIPAQVVSRAREILQNLERDAFGADGTPRRARGARPEPSDQPTLTGLFEGEAAAEDPVAAEVLAELRESRPETTTPLEALTRLSSWVERLRASDDD